MVSSWDAPGEPALVLSCGILADEVRALIAEHGLPVTARFLPPQLHMNLDRLEHSLTGALAAHAGRRTVVLYGTCHPRMDAILATAGAQRTPGQNCVEFLLGTAAFTEHLEAGAYFLLERWARAWPETTAEAFGPYPHVVREIFQTSHRYLLGIRTPVSGDFAAAAQEVSDRAGLPLRWVDVGLEGLGRRLAEALGQARGADGAVRC